MLCRGRIEKMKRNGIRSGSAIIALEAGAVVVAVVVMAQV